MQQGKAKADTAVGSGNRRGRFRASLSVSPYVEQMFEERFKFVAGDTVARDLAGLQRLFVANGGSEVYARIETRRTMRPDGENPGEDEGIHCLERGLVRARLAANLGLPFNPELGLFSNYGDLRFQPAPDFSDYPEIELPGPWASLTLDQMLRPLETYGASVAREILDTGARVNIWDLGNEVEHGIAGVAIRPAKEDAKAIDYQPPDAVNPAIGKMTIPKLQKMSDREQAAWLAANLWPANAKMFAAVAKGIRSVDPSARFSTHVSNVTTRPPVYVGFFKAMRAGGYTPDVLGFSYYPTIALEGDDTDRLAACKATLLAANRELRRPVFIAEYAYPADDRSTGLWVDRPLPGYPLSPDGQADFLRDFVEWGVRRGILSGMRPWAPELMGGWGAMALFAENGRIAAGRPALKAIVEGYRAARGS